MLVLFLSIQEQEQMYHIPYLHHHIFSSVRSDNLHDHPKYILKSQSVCFDLLARFHRQRVAARYLHQWQPFLWY